MMYQRHQVNSISEHVSPIIRKQFEAYLEEKRNSDKTKELILIEISKIENIQDMLNNLLDYMPNDHKVGHIKVDRLNFNYDEETDSFVLGTTVENIASQRVYESLNIIYMDWNTSRAIDTAVRAIISSIEPIHINDIIRIVEKNIDFDNLLVENNC